MTPAGSWDPVHVIDRSAQLLERRGIIVVISDFYDAEDETRREMRRVAQRGHDVAMLQLMSPQERALPFGGHVELEDSESSERRLVDAASVSSAYQTAMDAFLERCRGHAQRDGVDYALMTTDMPPEVALRQYLLRRSHAESARSAPRAVRS
jgi:dienelactone hydrolase